MTAPAVDRAALIRAVRQHATANYEKSGWDYVVESYSDDEIGALVARCRTERGAIAAVLADVKPLANYRSDIQGA